MCELDCVRVRVSVQGSDGARSSVLRRGSREKLRARLWVRLPPGPLTSSLTSSWSVICLSLSFLDYDVEILLVLPYWGVMTSP